MRSRSPKTGSTLDPIASWIWVTKVSRKFQVPNIKPDDVRMDPEEFLTLFNSQMMLLEALEGVKCKTFPCLLEK